MRSLGVVLVVSACVLGGCASGDDQGAAVPESTVTSSTGESPSTTSDQSANTTALAPSTTSATTIPASSFYGDFETVIAQRTAEAGGGIRPLLEWEAVPGADHYGVYLYAPSGAAYWAWRGRETQVHVGGVEQIRADAAGPSVAEGMAWAVVAYDVDLLPIAASPMRPINP